MAQEFTAMEGQLLARFRLIFSTQNILSKKHFIKKILCNN
jgi:hypothetical protein